MADTPLPDGFVLDQAPSHATAQPSLPDGFVLDSPTQMAQAWRARTGAAADVPTPFDAGLPATAPSRTVADRAEAFSSAAGDALTAGLMRGKTGLELAAAGVPVLTGNQGLSDYLFGKVASESDEANRLAAQAAGTNRAGAVTGNVLSFAPYIFGGEAALPARAAEVTGLLPRAIAGATRALPTAATIGTQQAEQQAVDVANAGGTAAQAEKAYLTALPTDTAVNLLPAGVPGALPIRAASGAVLAAGGQAAAQEAQHLANPQFVQAPTWNEATQGGLVGALMGAAFGHPGAEPPVPADPFLRNYAEGHQEQSVSPAVPRALPAPMDEPASAVAPLAPGQKPPGASPEEVFRADPVAALNALDHATVKQIAEDAGFDIKPGEGKPQIIGKIMAQGRDYLESDVLPEYLAAIPQAPKTSGTGPDTEMPVNQPPGASSVTPGITIPVDRAGTAYTPEQGALTFAQAMDQARGIAGRLPEPVTTVDSAGNAMDSASFNRLLDQQRQQAQNRLELGITPDIERSNAARWAQQENQRLANESDEVVPQREDFSPPWWLAGQYADEAHRSAIAALKKESPNAPAPLPPDTPVDTSHDVPLGGGVAKDNSRIYIDRHIPQFIDVPKEDGSGMARVNAWEDIAGHEAAEKPELDRGTHYYDAHEQNANHYEDGFLRAKYGVTRAAFDEALKPYLDQAESARTDNVPADLDRKPYEDGGDTDMLPKASNELAKLNIPEELHPQALQFLGHVERALDAGVPGDELRKIAATDDDLATKLQRINQLTQEANGHASPGNTEAQSVPRETDAAALRQAGEVSQPSPQQGTSEAGAADHSAEQQSTVSDRSDELGSNAVKYIAPEKLEFRETNQNRIEQVREMFPQGDGYYPAVTILDENGSRSILDGHNRAVVASERGEKLPIVDISHTDYDRLKNKGFDDIEIAYAALTRAGEDDAASSLNSQFPGSNVHRYGMDAYHELTDGSDQLAQNVEQPDGSFSGGVPPQFRRADYSPQVEGRAITELDSLVKRYGGSTLADSIANDLREHTTAQLIGQQVNSPEDLAALASVYRNPAFETMRYVYVDRAGTILGETAVSSRMPSTTHAFPTGTENGAAWVKEKAPDGAVGVWLIHNHPTGDPTASQGDIRVTQSLSIRLGDMLDAPKLKGHVILDHNTFGHIDQFGDWQGVQQIEGAPDIDSTRYGRGDFEMFEQKVTSPDFAAVTGKRIAAATPENSSAVVVMDAKGRVTSVHTFPNDFLVTPRGAAMLSRLGQKRGAVGLGLVMSTENFAKHREAFTAGAERGLFRDAIVVTPDGRPLTLNDTAFFPREQRKLYGQQSAGARARSSGGVQMFENTTEQPAPMISLSAVRRALADRGVSEEQIKAMTPEQLRAEQANMRRRSAPMPEEVKAGTATSIKDATVTEERAMKGKAAVEHDLSRSNPEAFATAKKRLEADPQYGAKLAADLVAKPRPHTQEEAMALALDRMRIINGRRAAFDQWQEAQKAGDGLREAAASAQIKMLDAQMEANDQAAELSGHETGAALQARRTMVKDDYTMASLVSRGKLAAGRDLSNAERSALEQRALDIERREKALAEREAELQNARRAPRKPAEQKAAQSKFESLAEKLKAIAQKDQMKPGCVV